MCEVEVGTWKLVPAMGTYLPKKYKNQFYCSRPNPYSGIPVRHGTSSMHRWRTVPVCLRVASASGAESIILSVEGAECMMLSMHAESMDTPNTSTESMDTFSAARWEYDTLSTVWSCYYAMLTAAATNTKPICKLLLSKGSASPSCLAWSQGMRFRLPCLQRGAPTILALMQSCWVFHGAKLRRAVYRMLCSSVVQNKMIIMGHQISSCHVPVVRSFFIL